MTAVTHQGLLVDWGGVLTASLDGAMAGWAAAEGVNYAHFRDVMATWVGRRPGADDDASGNDPQTEPVAVLEQAPDAGPAGSSPVHLIERGEMTPTEFEKALAHELALHGSTVDPHGLLDRLLGGLVDLDDDMVGLVRRARAAGLRTALLSNSWGSHYPDELYDGLFDAVVISGEVGMRKPEHRIFEHTAAALGLEAKQCVMVDDLRHNIVAAVEVGMVGVLHRTYAETALELEAVFGLPLR